MNKNRHIIISLLSLLFIGSAAAQNTMHTSGKYLLDMCGDTVLLNGIDYAPYNWGYDPTNDELPEITQTGANCVRLVWYVNNAAPYYTNDLLDSVLGVCAANQMIPILELHDQTCNDSASALIALAKWYTGDAVRTILQKHQAYLVVDIANEALYHNWASDPAIAVGVYISTYDTIVSNMRAAGLNFPLMIDAPDCGTDISVFSTLAGSIIHSDPQHNMLFSAHAYWYSYANNDSGQMSSLIQAAAALNVPVLIGEFANYQDGNTYCEYSLNYLALLHICEQFSFPRICWIWDNDECTARQLSNNGTFASLSAYGNDIINNAGYGIKANAVRSKYLLKSGSCVSAGIPETASATIAFTCYQTSEGILNIRSYAAQCLKIMDITGREVYAGTLSSAEHVSVPLPPAVYLIFSNKQAPIKQIVY